MLYHWVNIIIGRRATGVGRRGVSVKPAGVCILNCDSYLAGLGKRVLGKVDVKTKYTNYLMRCSEYYIVTLL